MNVIKRYGATIGTTYHFLVWSAFKEINTWDCIACLKNYSGREKPVFILGMDCTYVIIGLS